MGRIPVVGAQVFALFFGAMIMAGQDRNARSVSGTRSPVLARNGMICTSQPLATAAGLRILQEGEGIRLLRVGREGRFRRRAEGVPVPAGDIRRREIVPGIRRVRRA